jgi:hypothetical protein
MVYKGDGDIQTGECFEKLANESPTWFKQRKERAQQNNYLQAIVHSRYMPIYSKPINRDRKCSAELEKSFEVLDMSVDNGGTERDLFMRQGAEITSLLNRAFIVSDNYPIDVIGQFNTQEQLEKRIMPFFEWVEPDAVEEDYIETNVFGALTQFAYYFYIKSADYLVDFKVMKIYNKEGISLKTMMWLDKEGNPTETPGDDADRIKEFDKTMTNEMYLKYGELPVRTVKYTDNLAGNEILTTPNTLNIAKACYSIFIRQGETEMTLAKNNLALLVYPAEGETEGIDVSNDNVLFCPTQGNTPFYLAPDLKAIEVSYNMTEKDIENIFRQEGRNYATGTQSQSGLSKEMDNVEVNNQLSFLSQEMKNADEWIDLWFARWMGKENEYVSTDAKYTIDYSKKDIEKHLKLLGALMDLGGDQVDPIVKAVLEDIAEDAFENKKGVLEIIKEGILKMIPRKEVDLNSVE